MDLFKKNLKYMAEMEKFVLERIAMVKLLSFFKQIDLHLCVKFVKNRYFIY